MKFKIRFMMLLMAVSMSLASCGGGNHEEESIKELVSYDYKYKIETPTDWELQDKNALDVTATLYAKCDKRPVHLGIQVSDVGEDILPFDNFCNMIVRNINQQFYMNSTIDDFTKRNVYGRDMKYLEVDNIMCPGNDEPTHAWCYIADIDGCYVMFVAETLETTVSDKLHEEVELIISTFDRFDI